MAAEIRGANNTGLTLYAHILNVSGQRWNGTTFETYSAGNYANYAVSMAEQGASGAYFATFPALIITSGIYEYLVYLQGGGAPAEGDQVIGTGKVDWSGTITSGPTAGAMSGPDFLAYVLRIFKRTDKDTELYDAITDAVTELRRIYSFDESEVEITSTDTISVLGDFKFSLESDNGLLIGDIEVIDGDDSRPVIKISKEKYDLLYPNSASATATRDKPKHFAVFAGVVYLGPVPDSISYTYRLNYSKRGTTISAASVSVPFTQDYREPLRYGVLAKAFDGLDADLASAYLGKWEFFKQQIQLREENNQKGTGFVTYCGV